jgi:hypothetical protein
MYPAQPVAFWHYFDFITISVLTLVLIILMKAHYRKTGSLLGSISETVAYSKASSIIFSVTMTVCFPLYYAFVWFWVLPLIHALQWVYYLLLFSALCEMVFVWVPATVSKSKRIHGAATSVVVVAMFLLGLLMLATGVNLSIAARTSLIVFLASPLFIGILMAIKRFRRYTFAYEVICSVLFLVSLSLVGHT